MRLSLKLRPRAEGVDDHGRSGPSNEAASSIVSTGLMTRKTHTVGRVTLISPLPFLFPCASGSNVGNEARFAPYICVMPLCTLPIHKEGIYGYKRSLTDIPNLVALNQMRRGFSG